MTRALREQICLPALLTAALAICVLGGAPALAQNRSGDQSFDPQHFLGIPDAPVLTIQMDRLFNESAFGLRTSADIEADVAVLTAENRRIEAELRAEELDLTERRKTMEPEAFRALADAFDSKVQLTRQEQNAKFDDINRRAEQARRAFLKAAEPVLEQIMADAGASAVLDSASVVMSAPHADITNLAIGRINTLIGDRMPDAGAAQD